MSLVNQMLQDLDKRGEANAALVAAVPRGVNVDALAPQRPPATRSRKVVFVVSALAAAIAAAWYWPSQQATQIDALASQRTVSRQVLEPVPVTIASSQMRVPAMASVASASKPAGSTGGAAGHTMAESATRNDGGHEQSSVGAESSRTAKVQAVREPPKAAATQARSGDANAPRQAQAAKVAAATGPAPTGVAALPTKSESSSMPVASAAAAPESASLAPSVVAPAQPAPNRTPAPAASIEPAPLPKNNAVPGGVQRQTRQPLALDGADAAYREGLARFNAGDTALAVRSFRAALAQDPGHVRATEALAAVHVEQREWSQALTVLRDALAINPRQPSLAMLAARLLAREGNRETAVQTLKAATDDTSPANAHAALAALLGELKRDREAVPYWLSALKKSPEHATWWLGLAVALETDRRPADARAAYERALALGGLRNDSAEFARTRLYALR